MKREIKVEYDNQVFSVEAERQGDVIYMDRDGKKYSVRIVREKKPSASSKATVRTRPVTEPTAPQSASGNSLDAPMSGVVKDILVRSGEEVPPGKVLMIMEAMKMDIEIKSKINGIVKDIFSAVNSNVTKGQPLVSFE